jgi:hypothetical protein
MRADRDVATGELTYSFGPSGCTFETPAKLWLDYSDLGTDKATQQANPELIIFFANADQLSALVVMADYNRWTNQSVTAPFSAACQSILFAYTEAKKKNPLGVIGFLIFQSVRLLTGRF